MLVKEVDDGKSRNKAPVYEVYFESYGKPNAKGEKEHTRLIRMNQKSQNPSALKADQTIILLSGFV